MHSPVCFFQTTSHSDPNNAYVMMNLENDSSGIYENFKCFSQTSVFNRKVKFMFEKITVKVHVLCR